ncbi:MAG: class IIb bacteriocin, lactobin A/cerein 7B family [Gammaproteobacteria bacterium]|nr:class IIb bacteriocin, lactobin A/cerein 7B family [Gammaproteobacteria bacterium]
MKELTTQEMERTSGGFWPLVGFALSLIGKVSARGPGTWATGSGGLMLSTYQGMEYLDPLGSINSGITVGEHACYPSGG